MRGVTNEVPRKPHRKIVGRLKDHLQQEREDSLRELREAIHREQYERRQSDEQDHLGPDDDPYDR